MKKHSLAVSLFALSALSPFLLARPVPSQRTDSQQANQKPIVVVVEHTKAGLRYKVDSQSVADLLRSLSVLEQERGPNCPVIALLDPDVPLEWIWGVDGIAGKAQLTNVRVFAHFRDTGQMSEILLLPAVPYSTNPPAR